MQLPVSLAWKSLWQLKVTKRSQSQAHVCAPLPFPIPSADQSLLSVTLKHYQRDWLCRDATNWISWTIQCIINRTEPAPMPAGVDLTKPASKRKSSDTLLRPWSQPSAILVRIKSGVEAYLHKTHSSVWRKLEHLPLVVRHRSFLLDTYPLHTHTELSSRQFYWQPDDGHNYLKREIWPRIASVW